jgi:hypothetical protein
VADVVEDLGVSMSNDESPGKANDSPAVYSVHSTSPVGRTRHPGLMLSHSVRRADCGYLLRDGRVWVVLVGDGERDL